jgi:hypothetical protein
MPGFFFHSPDAAVPICDKNGTFDFGFAKLRTLI